MGFGTFWAFGLVRRVRGEVWGEVLKIAGAGIKGGKPQLVLPASWVMYLMKERRACNSSEFQGLNPGNSVLNPEGYRILLQNRQSPFSRQSQDMLRDWWLLSPKGFGHRILAYDFRIKALGLEPRIRACWVYEIKEFL